MSKVTIDEKALQAAARAFEMANAYDPPNGCHIKDWHIGLIEVLEAYESAKASVPADEPLGKCNLCGSNRPDGCCQFRAATSGDLFKELGAKPEQADSLERGLNAVIRREQMKIDNTEATATEPSTSDELDNGLDHDDIEALLIAYDHAKANGLPLSAIQPSIDIVKELLESSQRAANAGPLPDYRLTRGILKDCFAQPPAQQPAGVDENTLLDTGWRREFIAESGGYTGLWYSPEGCLFTTENAIKSQTEHPRPTRHPQPAQQEVISALLSFDEAMRNGSIGPDAEKHKKRALKAAHKKAIKVLAKVKP